MLKQSAEMCQNNHQLLIMIHAEPDDFKLRNLFRSEFPRMKRMAAIYGLQIGSIFMLGLDKTSCVSYILLIIKIFKTVCSPPFSVLRNQGEIFSYSGLLDYEYKYFIIRDILNGLFQVLS